MPDNKNLLIAVALSLVVLLGWSAISSRFMPSPRNTGNTTATANQQLPASSTTQSNPGGQPTTPLPIRDRTIVLAESPRVTIDTPALHGSINLRGARIDDLVLKRHSETVDANSPPVRLFSPAGTEGSYFAGYGWQGDNIALPGPTTEWQASSTSVTPGSPVTLSWANGQGQRFEIQLSVDENYMFTAEQRVTNAAPGAIVVRPYSFVSRMGPPHDPHTWALHLGPVGVFNNVADYANTYTNVATDNQRLFQSTGGWIGFSDQYWLAAIIPNQQASIDAAFRHNQATNGYQADVTVSPVPVQPGQGIRYVSNLFAGAKENNLLSAYRDSLGTPLDRAIDWGWFEIFMHPIFRVLMWLFHAIGNFGWAIICLVIIARLLLFPIAQQQFRSMGKMRSVQPKMKAIQERYKDDRQKMQEETLKLYREEKVNPAAGCLPVLLQIPIFYGLYRVLTISVEMRHQPWISWVRDLAAPDPLTPVNLFGLLPFTPPHILAIGILPIAVGVTMWIQQKLNPPMPDPVQRQIFAFMPVVLTFIMAPFAAGLQLYWATNNLLSIIQQKLLYMRHPEMAAPPEPAAPTLAKKK